MHIFSVPNSGAFDHLPGRQNMSKTSLLSLLILLFMGLSVTACGNESTRVDPEDDEEDPIQSSGPYSSDLIEVTNKVIEQFKKQKISDNFRARYNDAPIIAVIRPQNDTRFPEVTQIFQENLVAELLGRTTRQEVRFSQRDSDVQAEISKEKEAKEGGERTDRTGRRTKLGADYFLKAKFSSLSMTDGEYESDSILYTFELIDTETDELIFKGKHLIKRVSEKSAVYR
ncbi:MAG: hypothetical protein BroJett014_23030 [Planctomycetota bacterium]|nr:MAG: hypothetical protein BroJett014_23030 [Planctomycetota bacterium]